MNKQKKKISVHQFNEFLKNLERLEKELNDEFKIKYDEDRDGHTTKIILQNNTFTIYFETFKNYFLHDKNKFGFYQRCFVKVLYKNNCIQEFELDNSKLLYDWWMERLNKEKNRIIQEGNSIFGFEPIFEYSDDFFQKSYFNKENEK